MKCQICKALTPFAGVPHISISVPSSMRLIRAQILPNPNHGLRRLLHPLVREVCEGGRGSARISRHRCGRFFSTVVVASSDDAKNIQIGQKRLPKLERRIMVESFVNGYRTLSAGKFPTITAAQTEVGGSLYVIREILQDLEYNFVHNPGVGMNGNSLVEKKGVLQLEAEIRCCCKIYCDTMVPRNTALVAAKKLNLWSKHAQFKMSVQPETKSRLYNQNRDPDTFRDEIYRQG